MKYLLDYQFNIICSENFLIPRLNRKYNYTNNKISEYNIDRIIPQDKYCEIDKDDVEVIRSAYFSKMSALLSPKEMNWINNFQKIKGKLDLSNREHVKMHFYYIYLLLKLLRFNNSFIKKFSKKAIEEFQTLTFEGKEDFLTGLVNSIAIMIEQKEYWYIEDITLCTLETNFLTDVIQGVKAGYKLNYDAIEADYLEISNKGIVYLNYITNKEESMFTKGLDLNQQKNNLITVNRIVITKIGNELLKKYKLNSNETRIFKSMYGRLEKVLLISMESWE